MDLLQNQSGGSTTRDNTEYSNWFVVPFDIENRSDIQPNREGLLLSAFCINDEFNNELVIVIDNTSVDNQEVFTEDILKRCLFICHNADHEAKWGVATNFLPMRYACTMVNDRRLLSGQEGFRFDIISVITRRLGIEYIPIYMDKDVRSQFANCQFFTDEHILYNASDTIRLKQLHYKQLDEAEKLGQSFLHKTLNSRIIIPIAETEIAGIKHDSEKWISIAKDRKEKADNLCQELNRIILETHGIDSGKINPLVKKKRESLLKRNERSQIRKLKLQEQLRRLESADKTHLKSYKTTLEQIDKIVLEENSVKEQENVEDVGINWGSQKQVLEVLRQIGCPIPQSKDAKTRKLKDKLGKEARALWFVTNENTSFLDMFTKYDTYKKLVHNVTSFGEKWVEQYVRNGRAYTLFDQAGTATGRWTSGSKGGTKTHMNISQIPRPKEYRECFLADEGRMLVTCDYRNQEGVIIISLSGDMEMKKITEEKDQHSYLGTKAWRAVYLHRYNKTKDLKWKELSETYVMDKSTIDKEKERDKFKNSAGLFPVLYGCNANKVSATAQVTAEEGQIMLDVVLSHAPQAQKFLDSKSKEASTLGYVIHNTRSGSRRWFQKVLDNIHYRFPISKSELIDAEMEGRNTCVQGTGSCIMKEAIAMITLWSKLFKQDIRFVLSNYDEYVASVPIDKAEQYANVIQQLMQRAANNYLIKDVKMETSCEIHKFWSK